MHISSASDAADLLQLDGDARETDDDGTEVICNVNAELAIAPPQIITAHHIPTRLFLRYDTS